MVTTRPSVREIWAWLDRVPDPEIPVISLVDLGVIRKVAWQGEVLNVTVTPTYTGCPATTVIGMEIDKALRAHGIEKINQIRQLAPAWTTDWITEKGRVALRDYGIAPPRVSGGPDACPQCGSGAVTRISQFGSTPCKAQWRCDDCLEPFDYFKCI